VAEATDKALDAVEDAELEAAVEEASVFELEADPEFVQPPDEKTATAIERSFWKGMAKFWVIDCAEEGTLEMTAFM
jgi:hypothetical protein